MTVVETGYYIPSYVVLSYLVAFISAYAALSFSMGIVKAQKLISQNISYHFGSLVLGMGIWSMHFIGMLAYKMDMYVEYDPLLTALSALPAIIASYLVLNIIKHKAIKLKTLILRALVLGFGICVMHYMGMYAMHMDADIVYRIDLFALSFLIAVGASGGALYIFHILTHELTRLKFTYKILSAALMAAGICAMHYTGMHAMSFVPWADCRYEPDQSFKGLVFTIAMVNFIVVSFGLCLKAALADTSNIDSKKPFQHDIFYYSLSLLIFILGCFFSFWSFHWVRDYEESNIEKAFIEKAQGFTQRFELHLVDYENNLKFLKAVFLSTNQITYEQFELLSISMLLNKPDLRGLHYISQHNNNDGQVEKLTL